MSASNNVSEFPSPKRTAIEFPLTEHPQHTKPNSPNRPNANSQNPSFPWHDRETLRMFVQISLTLLILVFCMGKLTANDSDKALYWGGITSIIAWWMPSPGGSSSSS
jgi:hypothetical protein